MLIRPDTMIDTIRELMSAHELPITQYCQGCSTHTRQLDIQKNITW